MNKLNKNFFLLVILMFGAASLSANGGDAFIGGFAGGTMGGLVSGAMTQKSSDGGDSYHRLEERIDRIEDAIRKDLEHLYDRVKKIENKIAALAKGQTKTATETSE